LTYADDEPLDFGKWPNAIKNAGSSTRRRRKMATKRTTALIEEEDLDVISDEDDLGVLGVLEDEDEDEDEDDEDEELDEIVAEDNLDELAGPEERGGRRLERD
jgi:hypothetical protein